MYKTANKWNKHIQGDPCPCNPCDVIHSMHLFELPADDAEVATITGAGTGWITGGKASSYDWDGPHTNYWRLHHGDAPVQSVIDGGTYTHDASWDKVSPKTDPWWMSLAAQPGESFG